MNQPLQWKRDARTFIPSPPCIHDHSQIGFCQTSMESSTILSAFVNEVDQVPGGKAEVDFFKEVDDRLAWELYFF